MKTEELIAKWKSGSQLGWIPNPKEWEEIIRHLESTAGLVIAVHDTLIRWHERECYCHLKEPHQVCHKCASIRDLEQALAAEEALS